MCKYTNVRWLCTHRSRSFLLADRCADCPSVGWGQYITLLPQNCEYCQCSNSGRYEPRNRACGGNLDGDGPGCTYADSFFGVPWKCHRCKHDNTHGQPKCTGELGQDQAGNPRPCGHVRCHYSSCHDISKFYPYMSGSPPPLTSHQ